MIYKGFRFNIILRIILILLLAFALVYLILNSQMLFAPVVVGLFLLAIIYSLVRYIEKSNRDLTHLLLSIRQGAFTEALTSGSRGKQFEELSQAMNDVIREFANLNLEKEIHYQHLQALNDHINVAILTFTLDGKLIMMNPWAKKLLRLPTLSSINDFKKIDHVLFEALTTIGADQRKLLKIYIGQQPINLSIQSKELMIRDKTVKIIMLQNLNSELEEKEIEAWHQLMRVLTHEIMNSVTPIVTLTAAVRKIITDGNGKQKDLGQLSAENKEDIFSSLNTVASRSQGLLRFVNTYKEYSKPILLNIENADIGDILRKTIALLTPDLQQCKINFAFEAPGKPLYAKIDVSLIEQVVINLLRNAIEAVKHDGTGEIVVAVKEKASGLVSISVADNGPGMDQETLSRIFIPFYTTKSRGSGIGLSLSRQIVKLHNGSIQVASEQGNGSVFTIEL